MIMSKENIFKYYLLCNGKVTGARCGNAGYFKLLKTVIYSIE